MPAKRNINIETVSCPCSTAPVTYFLQPALEEYNARMSVHVIRPIDVIRSICCNHMTLRSHTAGSFHSHPQYPEEDNLPYGTIQKLRHTLRGVRHSVTHCDRGRTGGPLVVMSHSSAIFSHPFCNSSGDTSSSHQHIQSRVIAVGR